MMDIDNSRVKVLIVDDTPENLEIAGRVLERNGYDIYVADSGRTALELLENVTFDLILLDIMMPDMDGYETCRMIKKNQRCKEIPIIFLTAKADSESVAKGYKVGSVDYIRKPFSSEELLARVNNHVALKLIREELEKKNTILKEVCKELEIAASTDPLTKLLNRREMIRKLEQEKVRSERTQKPFSVVLADIDFFKDINDRYGHNCGDYLLQSVSSLLGSLLRKQDSVARWGGEEFLVLLPETPATGAMVIAEKLRSSVEMERFTKDLVEMRITMTFGVATTHENEKLDELIGRTDKAMYQGKDRGRNCTVVIDQ